MALEKKAYLAAEDLATCCGQCRSDLKELVRCVEQGRVMERDYSGGMGYTYGLFEENGIPTPKGQLAAEIAKREGWVEDEPF